MPTPYLLNAWYVAAWATELAEGTTLARTLLDMPVVMFREEQGTARALFDRCPHRFAPLSRGQLCGNALQCAYHGLRFDGEGRCVHNPHGDRRIPAAAKVRAFPLVERFSCLWIWMGDAVTPETATTTHYWFAISFPKTMGPQWAEEVEKRIDRLKVPFSTEDLPMLEAQQRAMGDADFWSLQPVLLASDAPAVRARRVLDKLIAEERAASRSERKEA